MTKILQIALCSVSALGFARAQMVRNDSIGNDPAMEKLCAERAKGNTKDNTVPFEIDSAYVARARSFHPDVTFIALDRMGVLVECCLRPGTGRYEPATMTDDRFWHLIKPQQFEPGIRTPAGRQIASNRCRENAVAKIDRPNFDHSVYGAVVEVNLGNPLYHPDALIAGKMAERYDVVVTGSAFYKSSGPDLAAVNFTCLFSPMLDVRAIDIKKPSTSKK